MRVRIPVLLIIAAFMAVSCGKDIPAGKAGGCDIIELQASFAQQVKATVTQTGTTSWSNGDKIAVLTSLSAIKTMTLSSVTDGVAAFSGSFQQGEVPASIAVFPSTALQSVAGNTITIDYPSSYTYSENALNAPMTALIDGDGVLTFTNVGGIISVPCGEVPVAAAKFFIAAVGQKINGSFEAQKSSTMAVSTSAISGNSKVSVSFENDGQPKTFNIPVPTGTYTSIYAAFEDADGNKISEWEVLDNTTVGRADMYIRPRPSGMLRLIGYNIRFSYNEGDYTDGDGRKWNERKQYAPYAIAARYPDLMGTQENTYGQINDMITTGLSAWSWCGRSNHGTAYNPTYYGSTGETDAIYYKSDKVAVLDKGTFWYSSTPDTPSRESLDYNMRCCNWAKLQYGAKELYHFNTHLQVNTNEAEVAKWKAKRVEQINAVLTEIKKVSSSYPVVLTADFNTTINDEGDAVDVLVKEGTLRECRAQVKNPHGSSGTLNYFKTATATRRIDYIFVNDKVNVHSYWADNSQQITQHWESDHNPVVVDISF